MNITLNNYEEYFLLLADNELSPAEEALVRQFAAQHPHLQDELQLLFSCRLDADDLPAFPKELLMHTTIWDVQNPEIVQMQMLNLLDNELPIAEAENLKQQIAVNPVLMAEWNTLQKAKLPVEAITYPNKANLYRQHKIRPLVWMRLAAAAAVFAIAWLLWPARINHIQTAGALGALPKRSPSVSTPAPVNKDHISDTGTIEQSVNSVAIIPSIKKQEQTGQLPYQPLKEDALAISKKALKTIKKETFLKEEMNVPGPEILVTEEPEIATLGHTNPLVVKLSSQEALTVQTVRITPKTILPTAEALPNTLAVNKIAPEEEEGYLHIAGARIDKHKIRGLFRGLTRSVARTFSSSKIKPEDGTYAARN